MKKPAIVAIIGVATAVAVLRVRESMANDLVRPRDQVVSSCADQNEDGRITVADLQRVVAGLALSETP